MANKSIKPINIAVQYGNLKSDYPNAKTTLNRGFLVWVASIRPTPVAEEYKVKMVYRARQNPDVYVIEPKLELFPKATSLPHVYSSEKQWLCLYYRKVREWKSDMLLTKTVVPWTFEWLYYYELWLATGKWLGGGNVHSPEI